MEPVMWDALMIEPSFEAVANSNCPIKLLEVLAHRCSVVDNSELQTLATIEQIESLVRQWQRSRGGTAMTTGVFKSHIEIYVQTACKSSGYFTFGSKLWEKYFEDDDITIMDYLGLSAVK